MGTASDAEVRARILDERIARAVQEQGVDTVLDLSRDLSQPEKRRHLLAGLGAKSQRALVLTKDLMRLSEEQVAALADELFRCPAVRFWFADLVSPEQKVAEVHFAPEDPQAFFHPFGWQPVRFHSFFLEARRLHRESPRNRCRRLFSPLLPEAWRESWRCERGVMEMRRAAFESEHA